MDRVAIVMDGGHVIKRLQREHQRFPSGEDVRRLATVLAGQVAEAKIYRVFFYHGEPYRRVEQRPLGGGPVHFADTRVARQNDRLLRSLDMSTTFAVRRGGTVFRGWRLSREAMDTLQTRPGTTVSGTDFVADLRQQGVDMRIGLDIAALALKRLVDSVVLVTGDADIVPAMRFARREGVQVGLCTLEHPRVASELRANADFTLHWTPEDERRPTR